MCVSLSEHLAANDFLFLACYLFDAVFRVLTLDDWPGIALKAVYCTGSWSGIVFFFIWIVVGNFMLLNLFLAILIRSFEKVNKDRR